MFARRRQDEILKAKVAAKKPVIEKKQETVVTQEKQVERTKIKPKKSEE